ncbi:uncharacterized protein METZ01_LOCUS493796, partial [marine metagenome]
GRSIQQTTDGGYIITGTWLIKTDSEGNEEWINESIVGQFDVHQSVQQTDDGGYIITGSKWNGSEYNDVLLIKTNSEGNEEWTQIYGGSMGGYDDGNIVQQTSDGGYIIIGDTQISLFNIDVWLIKTDSDGNLETSTIVGLPKTYTLSQPYPNPFNPTTTIEFSMPQTEFVTVKVYNIVGNEITTLINDELSIGNHTIQWDGSLQPSGVYFFKIESSGFVQSKKMVLLK